MEKAVRGMLKHRTLILSLFIVAAILGAILFTQVKVNFNMADYLPENAPSTVAMNVMEEVFDEAVPNLRVMVYDAGIPEALEYKETISRMHGVNSVIWLDDYVDVRVPLETLDADTVGEWYKDGKALFSITVDEEPALQEQALAEIRDLVGENGAITGTAVYDVAARKAGGNEIAALMVVLVPIVLFILFATTTSWFEPALFILNVGVAVMLNMGSNIFFGEISNITQTTAGVLQLACSMDYAIFLLDRFAELRREGLSPTDALVNAVTKSTSSILSSGLTTVVGFIALVVMQFRIGADLGVVLAKGIVCSLLSTLVFMPCLTAIAYPLIDKTSHRPFLPSFRKLGIGVDKVKVGVSVAILILVVPCALASQQNNFLYGMDSAVSQESREALDENAIEEVFGKNNAFVVLVPGGSMSEEIALAEDIKAMPGVTSLLSYAETVGNTIPKEFLPKQLLDMLESGEYTRIVVNTAVQSEGRAAFQFVEKLRNAAETYYPDGAHVIGETATIYDIKDAVTSDSLYVNLICIGAIALILLVTFRSFSLPLVLLLTIESAIFINFAIPYFMGGTLNYIGYLIISSVSLGATVDYAILFTNRYFENRQTMPKKEAARLTITNTTSSILTSGGILFAAGVVLSLTSRNGVISELGTLLARGALLSAVFVIVFLPALLVKLEWLIKKTTMGLKLYAEPAK